MKILRSQILSSTSMALSKIILENLKLLYLQKVTFGMIVTFVELQDGIEKTWHFTCIQILFSKIAIN